MKYFPSVLIALVLILGVHTSAQAQACYGGSCYGGSGAPQNELGVRLSGLTNSSSIGGKYFGDKALHAGIFNGIHYKRYGGIGALRLAVGLEHYDISETTDCPDCLRTEGEVNQWKFKAGYEVFTFFGPLEPYIGIDAVLALGRYEGETFTYGNSSREFWEYTEVRQRDGFGFAPVAGLRCYLGSFVSIGAETTFEAMLYNRRSTISNLNSEQTMIDIERNSNETTFHPVSWLSLNVLF